MERKDFENGFFRAKLTLPLDLKAAAQAKDWGQTDQLCSRLIQADGELFRLLYPFARQSRMEFIISVRDAANDWEEDGIWHDDGSRVLAFSMGLNSRPETIEGGKLYLREKGQQSVVIDPPAIGELIVFKTGVEGFEHKVSAVKKGVRVVMAGWCYK